MNRQRYDCPDCDASKLLNEHPRHSRTDDTKPIDTMTTDTTKCCPECDSFRVIYRVTTRDYRCERCGADDIDPDEREHTGRQSTRPGLAGVLEGMDADEVPP